MEFDFVVKESHCHFYLVNILLVFFHCYPISEVLWRADGVCTEAHQDRQAAEGGECKHCKRGTWFGLQKVLQVCLWQMSLVFIIVEQLRQALPSFVAVI